MGEVAGSNRQQPETIALSLTILELLLETGFYLWIVVQNHVEEKRSLHTKRGRMGSG